uniref:Uncharacterized protein n=1 Tax=Oryza sativa subsp. japonica TaxID=39947 RepID=Q84MQ5_ORYSJ|nr:hypothetical protein [Oryza sativa Japonica Group]
MGLRDGFSNNKLLDDFGCGEIQPVQVHLLTRSEPSSSSTTWSIEIIQASRYAAYQKMSDHMMSNEYAIRVVAPNLPTKTDDLSHSTGHGWTTREKWLSYDYYMVLDQRKILFDIVEDFMSLWFYTKIN